MESSIKFILDAMQEYGLLENDSPKHLVAAPTYTVYGDGSFVDVTIIEGERKELERIVRKSMEEIVYG